MTRSVVRRLRPGLLVVPGLLALSPGCDDLRPLDLLGEDLRYPTHLAVDRTPLMPLDVSSQDALDALEARYGTRPGKAALVDLLERLAARPGLDHPVLLQRIALLRAELAAAFQSGESGQSGFEAVIAAGTRLRERAPDSAEAMFIEGWIPYRLMRPDDRRPLVLSEELVPFAESVRDRWRALVTRHPDFLGPRGLRASDVSGRVEAIEAALRAAATPATPPAGGAAAAVPEPLSSNAVRALDALRRFESSPDGERRSICSAWPEGLFTTPDGAEVARLAFACHVHEGRLEPAVGAFAAVLAFDGVDIALTPHCREVRVLLERFGTTAVAGVPAMPRFACPAPR